MCMHVKIKGIASVLILSSVFFIGNIKSVVVSAAVGDKEYKVERFRKFLKKDKINGLILITDNNQQRYKVIKNKLSNINSKYEVQPNRYFPIASLQKIMTGMLIYDLVKENKLSWNTDLSRFYPNVKNSNKIKIRRL